MKEPWVFPLVSVVTVVKDGPPDVKMPILPPVYAEASAETGDELDLPVPEIDPPGTDELSFVTIVPALLIVVNKPLEILK